MCDKGLRCIARLRDFPDHPRSDYLLHPIGSTRLSLLAPERRGVFITTTRFNNPTTKIRIVEDVSFMIAGNPTVGRAIVVCAASAVLVVIVVFVVLLLFKNTPPSKHPPMHPAILVTMGVGRADCLPNRR